MRHREKPLEKRLYYFIFAKTKLTVFTFWKDRLRTRAPCRQELHIDGNIETARRPVEFDRFDLVAVYRRRAQINRATVARTLPGSVRRIISAAASARSPRVALNAMSTAASTRRHVFYARSPPFRRRLTKLPTTGRRSSRRRYGCGERDGVVREL